MFTNLSLVGLFTSMFTYVDMGGKLSSIYLPFIFQYDEVIEFSLGLGLAEFCKPKCPFEELYGWPKPTLKDSEECIFKIDFASLTNGLVWSVLT